MANTATVQFSGITTHMRHEDPHRVVLVDVSDPQTYEQIPLLSGLPPHTARLVVNRTNLTTDTVPPGNFQLTQTGDVLAWQLSGVKITIEGSPSIPPETAIFSNEWMTEVPSLQAHAPLPNSTLRPLDDIASIKGRAAAMLDIPFGTVTPVNYDERSGGAGVLWTFPADEVTVKFEPLDGTLLPETFWFKLKVPPPPTAPGPVEPLIRIENLGSQKDDERDFLFHYYALFGYVPENARPPRNLGFVDSGVGAGCSSSSYP